MTTCVPVVLFRCCCRPRWSRCFRCPCRPCPVPFRPIMGTLCNHKAKAEKVSERDEERVGLVPLLTYNNKLWSEHLSDLSTYREIPPNQIHTVKVHMKYKLGELSSNCQKIFQKHELTCFSRLRDQDGNSFISI